jgi:hypothetical protein
MRPIPVLPLVASTIVSPGFSSPRRSASSTIEIAMRSFTDESGLNDSILTTTSAAPSGTMRLRRISGVLPIVSVMLL